MFITPQWYWCFQHKCCSAVFTDLANCLLSQWLLAGHQIHRLQGRRGPYCQQSLPAREETCYYNHTNSNSTGFIQNTGGRISFMMHIIKTNLGILYPSAVEKHVWFILALKSYVYIPFHPHKLRCHETLRYWLKTWKTNLGFIEVLHPHTVNRGTQTSRTIGLSGMHRFTTKTAQHLGPIIPLHFITLSTTLSCWFCKKLSNIILLLNNIIPMSCDWNVTLSTGCRQTLQFQELMPACFVLYYWHYMMTSSSLQLTR